MITVGQAIDNLVARCAASSILPTGCVVSDGYPIAPGTINLVIGELSPPTPGDLAQEDDPAPGAQSWGALGARARKEQYVVNGYALAFTGSDTYKPARDAAIAAFRVVERVIVTDPTLGLTNGTTVTQAVAGIDKTDLLQLASDSGRAVWVAFAVHVQTTLANS